MVKKKNKKKSQSPTKYLEQDLHHSRHSEQRFKISDCVIAVGKTLQDRICFLDPCNSWKQRCDIQRAFKIHSISHLQSAGIMINNVRNEGEKNMHVRLANPAVMLLTQATSTYPVILQIFLMSFRRKELKACCLDNDFNSPKLCCSSKCKSKCFA